MKNNSIITKKLRSIVNEEIIKEAEEMQKRKAVHAIIVDITKAGSDGMKAMKSVRAKKCRRQKLRQLFRHILMHSAQYMLTC
jgi:response regulator RpfG family c-di-GMP phosphodiesterase